MVHMGSHVLFVFAFQKCFLKKLKLFLFFYLLQINIFFVFLDHFDVLISKIIFKNKKILFDIFLSKKHFKK
jgi:hypothetical protein